ncbi:hypothetical protein EYR41_007079 [Orbilia oligospora]|uniref:ribonuclease Z n=2 Tax=Orbilia oligospora TaxID=2813651 RepID=A0A7C8K677_ORBOL|nr:hypothetical protein TWF751_009502 [Orbilia oligospora]KAF3293992.1 hypothetical protein TWF132_003875 [Orbilia oligospora]KAF3293993.1 hypothetical protein TWF132_003875 [Orbilia oligospora]TGJ67988.1 hypothetical protein EYR41_007079 [Orbilia oligospora]
MKSYVELVTVPSRDNNSTLLMLHFDEKRYVFGQVAEGTQRMLGQNMVKMNRISDIFLSGKTEWSSTGGLTGLLLTMGDAKAIRDLERQQQLERKQAKYAVANPDGSMSNPYPPPPEPKGLTIHGGKNILSTMATTRNFVFRENSGINFHEYDFLEGSVVFKDDFVTVRPLRAFPRQGSSTMTVEENRLREIEDIDLGSREQLKSIVDAMWNGKPGSLQVGKDDEDYVISLVTRLKEDEQRQRNEKAESSALPNKNHDRDIESESPPKRLKLNSDQAKGDEEPSWDGILEASETGRPIPEFSASRPLRRPWPATYTRSLPGTIPSTSALSYMISIAQVRGRFRPDIAKKLGVKPGPDFRILTDGGSVTLEDGTIIHSTQCLDHPRPVNGIAFLDIPDENFLESTIEEINVWKEERKNNKENCAVSLWVWVVGPNIETNKRLLDYIDTLDGQHMINSPTSPFQDMSLKDSAAQATRLNLLDNENFPLPCPGYSHPSGVPEPEPTDKDRILRARDSLLIDVHPTQGVQLAKLRPRFDYSLVQREVKTKFGDGRYWRAAKAAHEKIAKEAAQRDPTPSAADEVELVTLGTGSSMPSKYRNVSATAVTVPGFGNILLDCGESTLNQLRRSYGQEKTAEFLKNMKILYISHLHADHHLGTIAVLKAWFLRMVDTREDISKLYLIAPSKFLNFLEEYTQIENYGLRHINFISCDSLLIASQQHPDNKKREDSQRIEEILSALPLEKIETSRAVHCRGSFTVAFTFKQPNGFKLAYSGDTRPTNGFVEIGKDCTVLLHEATFDDELRDEALAKRHCTTSEAIQAGKDMGAKNLLLTHFSQRYPKLPNIRRQSSNGDDPLCDPFMETSEERGSTYIPRAKDIKVSEKRHDGPIVSKPDDENAMHIGFAFDMMRVKVKDFWKLESFIPALEELFKQEEKLDDELSEPNENLSKGQSQDKNRKGKKKEGPTPPQPTSKRQQDKLAKKLQRRGPPQSSN